MNISRKLYHCLDILCYDNNKGNYFSQWYINFIAIAMKSNISVCIIRFAVIRNKRMKEFEALKYRVKLGLL